MFTRCRRRQGRKPCSLGRDAAVINSMVLPRSLPLATCRRLLHFFSVCLHASFLFHHHCSYFLLPSQTVKVDNFNKSWKDGLAFCAIFAYYHPELLDFSKCDSLHPEENLKLAFSVGEKVGIAALLDPEGINTFSFYTISRCFVSFLKFAHLPTSL